LRSLPDIEQTLLVAMSGYPRDSDQQDAAPSAFDHFLTKPISFEAVQKFLAEQQMPPAQPWN
jgi:CheY-like chemotaxis protein